VEVAYSAQSIVRLQLNQNQETQVFPPLLTFSLEHSILDIENNINVRRKAYMQDINALLETALKEAKNLKPGESFLVKDLFKGYLWNRIPRGDRLLLGSLFLSHVSANDCQISVSNKGASGQQRYQKK